MLREIGSCKGIENYSRHLNALPPGARPYTLLDYFPDDLLIMVDESHIMLPQLRGMYAGDRSRKQSLVDYGFRLPSALDNRPLNFGEFEKLVNQIVYVSATPGDYEIEKTGKENIVTQIIRPTGLLDPTVEVRPTDGQIDDLIGEIQRVASAGEKILVTTLTKKMAESLTNYLKDTGIRVRYLHSDIDTIERTEIIRSLRADEFDVLVGINLLREGLDIPEVSLVAILDADKQGFLRNERSLIQTIGRAARNAHGRVIMYGDTISPSMREAIDVTEKRRKIQDQYNQEHGIIPQTIRKSVRPALEAVRAAEEADIYMTERKPEEMTGKELREYAEKLKKEMNAAAEALQFEQAALLRDRYFEIKAKI